MTDCSEGVGSRRVLIKNSAGIFLSRVITLTVSFLSIPIVVQRLGVEGYGVWESILAVSMLCNIFQSTISGTLLWKVSNLYGSADSESACRYIRTGVFFALLIFGVVFPLAWVYRQALVDLLHVPQQFRETVVIVLPGVVGLVLLGALNEVMGSLINGYQRAGVTTLLQATALTCNNLLVIVCLKLNMGFWSLFIGFLTGYLISFATLTWTAMRLSERSILLPKPPDRSMVAGMGGYAAFMLVGAVSVALRDQTDRVVLSTVASTLWTGYYGLALRIASVIPIVCTFFYVPTIAATGALHSRGDTAGVSRLYQDAATMMAMVVGAFLVLISCLHDHFLILWIGRTHPEVGVILVYLVIGYTVAVVLTGAGSSVCKGVGNIGIESVYIVVCLLLNVLLKILFVPRMGALGTVISSAASWSMGSVLFIVMMHRQTRLPWTGTLVALKIIAVAIAYGALSHWLVAQFPLPQGRGAALKMVLFFAILLMTGYAILMTRIGILPPGILSHIRRRLRVFVTGAP